MKTARTRTSAITRHRSRKRTTKRIRQLGRISHNLCALTGAGILYVLVIALDLSITVCKAAQRIARKRTDWERWETEIRKTATPETLLLCHVYIDHPSSVEGEAK